MIVVGDFFHDSAKNDFQNYKFSGNSARWDRSLSSGKSFIEIFAQF